MYICLRIGESRETLSNNESTVLTPVVCLFHGAECVLVWRGCVAVYMCFYMSGFVDNNMPVLLAFLVIIIIMIIERVRCLVITIIIIIIITIIIIIIIYWMHYVCRQLPPSFPTHTCR